MNACRQCGRAIRWVLTAKKRKWIPWDEHHDRPHWLVCGRRREREFLAKRDRLTAEKESVAMRTNPLKLRKDQLYDGERAPWDFPGPIIFCVRSRRELERCLKASGVREQGTPEFVRRP